MWWEREAREGMDCKRAQQYNSVGWKCSVS